MDKLIWHGRALSRLTLGTVQLGLNYGIANQNGQPDAGAAYAILQTAADLGVTVFDTALHYGNSEAVLGSWLAARPAGQPEPTMVTKFKLTCADDADERTVEQDVRTQLETSLSRLGLRQVPLYLLHNSQDLRRQEANLVRVLGRLTREGLIGAAGVSIYGPDDVDKILSHDVFQAIQAPMNLFDTRLVRSGALGRLAAAGLAVFIRSVYLQGLFFMPAEKLPPALSAAAELLAGLRRLAETEGLSIAQLAISYVRDMPGVTSLVVGAERADQIAETAVLLAGPPLSERAAAAVADSFADVPEQIIDPNYWRR